MFARFPSFFLLAIYILPVLAVPGIVPRIDPPINQCNTGPIQCCNSVHDQNNQALDSLLGLLSIVLGPITGFVGVNCSPITVIGTGGNSCTSQPVCCTNNHFNGLINLGCSPIAINL
ncbi:hydrophobin [Tricholoma matsutake]|nr:hydrophobin [Tricholoma matsutake 945]